jgi:hypothetical protein
LFSPEGGDSLFKPALADVAPGTGHVGDDVDTHRRLPSVVGLSERPRLDAAGRTHKDAESMSKQAEVRKVAPADQPYDAPFLQRNAANFAALTPLNFLTRAAGVYPGVDLVYYGNQRQLEFDFVVQAGSDPGLIRFKIEGADRVEIDDDGDLVLQTKSATGHVKSTPMSNFVTLLKIMKSVIATRISGNYKRNPFFVEDSGAPIKQPRVLTKAERTRVTSAA